jgi:predicted esterase
MVFPRALAIGIACFLPLGGLPYRAAARANQETAARQESTKGETLWLVAGGLNLKTRVSRSAKIGESPVLILVLHGDSPFRPPSYQYEFAQRAASELEKVVVVALLRPGYCDEDRDCSSGVRGLTTGDNYTPEVLDAVAEVIVQLKAKYHASAVIVVGHSGGAAIAADLIGRAPSVAQGALLVSCPCDLWAWRQHMYRRQASNPVWLQPVKSLSPMDLAKSVSDRTHVLLLVGSKDPIAPPDLTERYAAALEKHGVSAPVTVAPNLEHDILLEPIAYEQLKALVETVKEDAKL